MAKRNTHYGDLLRAEIDDKGYQLNKIAEKLEMSYRTLMERLSDGEFTMSQVEVLQANRYLPEDL